MDITRINSRTPDGINPAGASYRILIVDDSAFIQKQLSQILVSEKYDIVGTGANGQEAIDRYMELKPDLVTCDITMPVMDGLTALTKILEFDPKAKVIMVSSHSDSATVKDGLMKGAKNFILKPFDRNTVLERIRAVIKN
jgi:two-component system chemotaxis response regulator CheY